MSRSERGPTSPAFERQERSGSVLLLILFAVGLVGAATGLSLMDRQEAEPWVLGLLGMLAVVGVFSLFAGAIGLLSFSSRAPASPVPAAFLDTMEDGVLVTERDGRIVYANDAYARLIGAQGLAEMRGVERVFSSDPAATDAIFHLTRAAEAERAAEEEIRLPHPLGSNDGEPCWYRVRVRPLSLASGRGAARACTVWQLSDISGDRTEQETS